MDICSDWATRLALEVAPGEVDLAPVWVQAYVSGGRQRSELFKRGTSGVASFSAGTVVQMMPALCVCLAAVSPDLRGVLQGDLVSNLLACLKNALAWLEVQGKAKTPAPRVAPAEPHEAAGFAQLKTVMSVMSESLCASGIEREKSEVACYRVVVKLLEEPRSADLFLQQLGATAK